MLHSALDAKTPTEIEKSQKHKIKDICGQFIDHTLILPSIINTHTIQLWAVFHSFLQTTNSGSETDDFSSQIWDGYEQTGTHTHTAHAQPQHKEEWRPLYFNWHPLMCRLPRFISWLVFCACGDFKPRLCSGPCRTDSAGRLNRRWRVMEWTNGTVWH